MTTTIPEVAPEVTPEIIWPEEKRDAADIALDAGEEDYEEPYGLGDPDGGPEED